MPCDPNIYGPFSQTLFMGASVVSASTRMGWNSNESSLDVEVVEDPCSLDKIYYDCATNPQNYTGVDSFIPPPLGSPVYFQWGSLSYTGILRNWKEKYDTAKTYTISCSGPNVILDGIKVIVGGYTGDVFGIPNIINAYGFLEELSGDSCPIDSSLATLLGYSPALGFGGAQRTDAGISWNSLRYALSLLISDPAPLSGKFGGRPEFKGYHYLIDISDLPLTAMDDLRFGGDSISLLDIINTVCNYAGFDWYSTLYIDPSFPGTCNTSVIQGTIASDATIYIKINVSDRKSQPSSASSIDLSSAAIDTRLALGTITTAIASLTRSSSDRGVEFRPETTNALIVGDQRQDLWVMDLVSSGTNTYDNNIWQYWGKNESGYPIISAGYYDKHNFNITITDLYQYLVDDVRSGELGSYYNVEMGELLAILADGGKSNWEDYIYSSASKSGIVPYLDLSPDGQVYNIVGAKGAVTTIKTDNYKNTSRYSAQQAMSVSIDENVDFAQRLYNKLEGYANEYLGKKFLVYPPIICSADDADTPFAKYTNWVESDGAWSDTNPWSLPNTPMELFRLNDGKIKCMLQFDNNNSRIDMTSWDATNYYQPGSGIVYVQANAEEIVFLDPVNMLYPRVVVSIDKPVSTDKVYLDGLEYDTIPFMGILMDMFVGGDRETRMAMRNKALVTPGADTTMWNRYPMPLLPAAAAVPLKSNVLRYGPWYAGVFAEAGPTNFEIVQDLNPWTYGSTANMNLVGVALASGQVLEQQVIEMGAITVPGAPSYSLGAILVSDGPEVTNIDVSLGINGLSTTYQLRTYTPDYNTFSKTRIDLLRKNAEQIRYTQRLDRLARINQTRTPSTNNSLGTIINRSDRYKRTSSHAFMLASSSNDYDVLPGIDWADVSGVDQLYATDRILNGVVHTDLRKCLPELGAGSGELWLHRAGMETAGLFRPFTTKSGELCDMACFPSGISLIVSSGTSPILYNDELYKYSRSSVYEFRGPVYNEAIPPIMCSTLNPFMQHSSIPNSGGNIINIEDSYDPTNIYFTIGSGWSHDIEYIIRDGVYPVDLSVKYPTTNYSDDGWYRGIGIKGPPIIVGWGFDVNGKPVPNKNEILGSGGTSCQFADDWLQRPDLWKAGPLDIRWDYHRGVWTSPPPYRIVKVKMVETNILGSLISAEIVDDICPAYDYLDDKINRKFIKLQNSLVVPAISGAYGYAVYDSTLSSPSGLYAQYHLISYNEPTFIINTIGPGPINGYTYDGASGVISSLNPGYANDFGQVLIKNAAAASGYIYTCKYYQYNEPMGRHEFLPLNNTIIQENVIVNDDTALFIDRGNQTLNINNWMNIPTNVSGIATWNNVDQWIITNARAYYTPVA
jgi:hypothetical protein